MSFGAFDLLALGDLTRNVGAQAGLPEETWPGVADVYQVTHHGNSDSNDAFLVEAVAPTVAVVNNGPRKGGKADVYQRLQAAQQREGRLPAPPQRGDGARGQRARAPSWPTTTRPARASPCG